jgi:hypothetical protein
MNAIAALPSLAVAPRARVTRKSAAKNVAARATRVTVMAQKKELQAPKASKQHALIASTALVALAAASPAHAGDLFGPEYSGVIGNVVLFIVGGIGAVSALFLPIICGTLNPVQIAVNLGLVEGEVSNLRKFKRNGEPMDHGVKFGHKWYDTDAYCNGKYVDFCGTQQTGAAQEGKPAPKNPY